MIWNTDKMEILDHEIGAFSISVKCHMVESLFEWSFLGVYGSVLESEIDDFLGELDDVKARWNLPWCLGGDFNLVRFSHEWKGEGSRVAKMQKIGNFIDRWKLIDSPLKGAKFTWSNFREYPSLSRLDKFLFCNEWEEMFSGRVQGCLQNLSSLSARI